MELTRMLEWVRSGDRAAIDRAWDAGEIGAPTNDEKLALVREAAKHGQARMLRFLFEQHHLYATDDDAQGRTLLHFAAMSGDPETVMFAMQVLGFDPMTCDSFGKTALDYACAAPQKDAYEWLCETLGFDLDTCYRNPILRGFHPDPSIVRVGEDYYMVHSTFAYFPGLPISHSRDLVHWEVIGHAVENLAWSRLGDLPGGYGYWAPDLSFDKGKFWVAATLRRHNAPERLQMLTWASDPRGPWSKPVFVPLDGIDPSLFTDTDGRRYILLNPGAIIAEISDEGELLSEPEMLSMGSTRIKSEGPHLVKKDGWYYLFLAEGGTGAGHMETVARSRTLRGPYESCPWNPILGRKNPYSPIGRSGHGKPVSTPDGRWFMVYLCGRQVEGDTVMGRETAIDPMDWPEGGWPMVNALRGPSALQKTPFGNPAGERTYNREWLSPRADFRDFARMEGNAIHMLCGKDPALIGQSSVLVRRQAEACFTHSVHVDLTQAEDGSLAGLCGYYDERSFFVYGLRNRADVCELVVRQQVGDEESEQVLLTLSGPSALLRVDAQGMARALLIFKEGEWVTAAHLRTPYLADAGVKGGKRFTGATFGLAAIGGGTALMTDYMEEMWE